MEQLLSEGGTQNGSGGDSQSRPPVNPDLLHTVPPGSDQLPASAQTVPAGSDRPPAPADAQPPNPLQEFLQQAQDEAVTARQVPVNDHTGPSFDDPYRHIENALRVGENISFEFRLEALSRAVTAADGIDQRRVLQDRYALFQRTRTIERELADAPEGARAAIRVRLEAARRDEERLGRLQRAPAIARIERAVARLQTRNAENITLAEEDLRQALVLRPELAEDAVITRRVREARQVAVAGQGGQPVAPPADPIRPPVDRQPDLRAPQDADRRFAEEAQILARDFVADLERRERELTEREPMRPADDGELEIEIGRVEDNLKLKAVVTSALALMIVTYAGWKIYRRGGRWFARREAPPADLRVEADYSRYSRRQLDRESDRIVRSFNARTVRAGYMSEAVLRMFSAEFRSNADGVFSITGNTPTAQAQARAAALQEQARRFIARPGLGPGIDPGRIVVESVSSLNGCGRQLVRHAGSEGQPAVEGALSGRQGNNVRITLADGKTVLRPVAEVFLVIQIPEAQLNHATGTTGEGSTAFTRAQANEVGASIFRFLAQADMILNNREGSSTTLERAGKAAEVAARRMQLEMNAGRLTPNHNTGPVRLAHVDVARVVTSSHPQALIQARSEGGVVRYELVSRGSSRALSQEEGERLDRQLREYYERLYDSSIANWERRANDTSLSESQRQQARLIADSLVQDQNLYRSSVERRAEVHAQLPAELARPNSPGWRTTVAGVLGRGGRVVGSAVILLILAETARHMLGGSSGNGRIPVVPVGPGS